MADEGMLIDGELVTVDGVTIRPPRFQPWAYLARGQPRVKYPQQAIIHKTIADDPEHVIEEPGPGNGFGGCEETVRMWEAHTKADPNGRSGTQLIAGYDGSVVCTEDLVRFCGYHAHEGNLLSFGIEIKEHYRGGVHRITIINAVKVVLAACDRVGIQRQMPIKYKNNTPIYPRFNYHDGGKDLIGIFGHRDCTDHRGYWDPGDVVFEVFEQLGHVERFDFYAKQDLDEWSNRQDWYNTNCGADLAVDGLPGAKTTEFLKLIGFPDGIFARWRELPERPPMPPWVQ